MAKLVIKVRMKLSFCITFHFNTGTFTFAKLKNATPLSMACRKVTPSSTYTVHKLKIRMFYSKWNTFKVWLFHSDLHFILILVHFTFAKLKSSSPFRKGTPNSTSTVYNLINWKCFSKWNAFCWYNLPLFFLFFFHLP